MGLQVKVLGPLQVERDGEQVSLDRPARRRLLAILALANGGRVSTDVLIDRFWNSQPPETARAALQTHISGLRKELGDGVIATEGYGYRLNLEDNTLDSQELDMLASSATKKSGEQALAAVESALAHWAGNPYQDVADDEFARPEIARLTEVHLEMLERHSELLIELGRSEEALPALEALVIEHPYRERLWQHLMTARYRLGRTTDALRAYQEVGDHLAEIGTEPGERLRRLEEKILLHDSSLSQARDNLPVELDSFVGRQREIDEISERLDTTRLLTLTGAGGSGKTRLAIKTARGVQDRFPDGLWFVELADLNDGGRIPERIADAAGLDPGESALETICRVMAHDRALVILDNCEHLVVEASQVATELLESGASLKVLTTSRAPLRARGETVFRVPGLELSEVDNEPAEAMELFIERARLDRNTQPDVIADICRRLEGMPLAIELAAARAATTSPADVVARLDNRLDLLTAGQNTAPERHQTLRATIEWSYNLLAPEERRVLDLLTVFQGGFDLDMAEFVCSDDEIPKTRVAAMVATLVDSSLVSSQVRTDTQRFRLLETIREYASQKLEASDPTGAARQRHSGWCVQFSESVYERIHEAGRSDLLDRIHLDYENLLAGYEWAESQGNGVAAGQIASAILWHWEDLDHGTNTMMWMERAIETCDVPLRRAELRAMSMGGHFQMNDAATALAEGEFAYEVFSSTPASVVKSFVARSMGSLTRVLGEDMDASFRYANEAVDIAVELEHQVAEVRSRLNLALTYAWTGDSKAAFEELDRAAEMAPTAGDIESTMAVNEAALEVAALTPGARRERFKRYADRTVAAARDYPKWRHYHFGWVGWAYLQSGDWDLVEALVAVGEADRHVVGYELLNHLFVKAGYDWMRGDLTAAQEDLIRVVDAGLNPKWEHAYYTLSAEVHSSRSDIEEVRAIVDEYVSREYSGADQAKKIMSLAVLIRAEVDNFLEGKTTIDETREAIDGAMDSIVELKSNPGAMLDVSDQMETPRTTIAFATAEASRLQESSPELWTEAQEAADNLYYRLYAQIRQGEAAQSVEILMDAKAEADRVGARYLSDLAEGLLSV